MLPRPLTPFIGRHQEMADLRRLWANPDCRLLTLVGPGGIGKTRLALAVADRVKRYFAGGAAFVPLPAVTTAEFLVTAIADALTASWSDQDDLQTQLFNYLHDKTIVRRRRSPAARKWLP
jgi:predicted ATPase